MGQFPSNEEQLMLQLINRARSDPQSEMSALFDLNDDDIENAVDYFVTNRDVAAAQVAQTPSAAPLAWNADLAATAEAHNDLMILFGEQSHQLPGEASLGDRLLAEGYEFAAASESIYAYSRSIIYGHAGFYIDWGFGPDGIQSPAGHRDAMLDPTLTEVGVAVESYTGQGLGPYVITHHYGAPSRPIDQTAAPTIVGAVIDDRDGDGFYDIGEGLGGIQIIAEGGGYTFRGETWASGGYALTVAPNVSYVVTFSGDDFGGDRSFILHVETENVSRDAIAIFGQTPILVTGPTELADALTGTDEIDRIFLLGGDDIYLGRAGDDEVYGGAGNDRLEGEAGDDWLLGGGGDDWLLGGTGNDQMDGADGLDWVVFDGDFADYSVSADGDNLLFVRRQGSDRSEDRVTNAEYFQFDDICVSVGYLDAVVTAQSGDPAPVLRNAVAGSGGSETVFGTAGGDEIATGAGKLDIAYGSEGADTFVFGDELQNGVFEQEMIPDYEAALDALDLNGAAIMDWHQTSQGVILILEGDGDVVYLRGADLSFPDIEVLVTPYG